MNRVTVRLARVDLTRGSILSAPLTASPFCLSAHSNLALNANGFTSVTSLLIRTIVSPNFHLVPFRLSLFPLLSPLQ